MADEPKKTSPLASLFILAPFVGSALFGAYMIARPKWAPAVAIQTRWILTFAGIIGSIIMLSAWRKLNPPKS